jgi:hypothetical protein
MLVFHVIHTTAVFLFTDTRKMWNVLSSNRVEMPSQKDKTLFI